MDLVAVHKQPEFCSYKLQYPSTSQNGSKCMLQLLPQKCVNPIETYRLMLKKHFWCWVKQKYSVHQSSTCFISLQLSAGSVCVSRYVSLWAFWDGVFFHWPWISVLVRLAVQWALNTPATVGPQAREAMSRFLWEYWWFELRSSFYSKCSYILGHFPSTLWVFKSRFVKSRTKTISNKHPI